MSLKGIDSYKWISRRGIILLALPVVIGGIVYGWGGYPARQQTATSSSTSLIDNNAKGCPGVEVSSIDVSAQYAGQGVSFDLSPAIKIERGVTGEPIKITAFGPVFGSMDSIDVKTNVVCTEKGFAMTATVTRSSDYYGAAAKNVLWRPRVEIAVVLREPKVIFDATWKLKSTTGSELDHAQTPTYPEQKYPITLTKTLILN